jgi:hypothetical protein
MDTDADRLRHKNEMYKDYNPKRNTKFLTKDDKFYGNNHDMDTHPLHMFMLDLDGNQGLVEVLDNSSIYDNQFYLLSDADTVVDFIEMRKANKKVLAAKMKEQDFLTDLLIKSHEVVYLLSNFQYDTDKKGIVKSKPGANSLELLAKMAHDLYITYRKDSVHLEAETDTLLESVQMEDGSLNSRLHTMLSTLLSLIHGMDKSEQMLEFFDKKQ